VSARAYRLLFWLGLLLLLALALGLVQSILMPFATGFAIAYVLAPGVARLESWGVRRSLASLFVIALFMFGLALILVILVPLVQGQVVQLIAGVPTLVRALQDQLGKLILLLQEHLPAEDVAKVRDLLGAKLAEAVTWLAGLVQGMITSSLAILNIVSLVVVTPIVTFFLLRDWERMIAQIDSYLPRQSLDTVRGQARLVSDTLVGFVHGQALICLILAIYYGTALTLAGLASGMALGLLIGVLAIIPMLGVTTGFVLALGLAAIILGYSTFSRTLHLTHTSAVERENTALSTEIAKLTGRIDSLSDTLDAIGMRDDRIRLLANLEPIDPQVQLAGIGGPERARPEPASPAGSYPPASWPATFAASS